VSPLLCAQSRANVLCKVFCLHCHVIARHSPPKSAPPSGRAGARPETIKRVRAGDQVRR